MSVAAGAGVLSPSALARGILALLSVSLFRIHPVMVIFPLRKQIIRRLCNFFAIADSLFVRAKCKLAADQPICYAFAPRYALWRPAAIPNRKEVAIRGVFLFLGSLDRLERCSGMNLGPACEQSGLGSAAGAFGRALGGVPGVQCWAALGTGLLAGVVDWHRACATNEGLGFMPGAWKKKCRPKGRH